MKILGISRSPRFSPNSVDRDNAIFEGVAACLRRAGHTACGISEDDFETAAGYDIVYSMGRDREFLLRLNVEENAGLTVVNSAKALLRGSRAALAALFESQNLPVAPSYLVDKKTLPALEYGRYWLKRGDACAQSAGDVCLIDSEEKLRAALDDFTIRGIAEPLLSPHIEGDLVKFYGVEGTDFFYHYYPTADGAFSKFGLESHNGCPVGFAFSPEQLKKATDRAALLSGFTVYGGDCIVRADGSFLIIDFNDWPSFSLCRDAAAAAIAQRLCVQQKKFS